MMDIDLRAKFIRLWADSFGGAALPICLYYSDDEANRRHLWPMKDHACLIPQLGRARKGGTLSVDADSIGCDGGKKYLGFTRGVMPNFEYFLSCGIPGKLEGERYKKSPEIVRESMARLPVFEAPAKYAVFKRWDKLTETDRPEVVIFFAEPDVISGLFTLSNFDETDPQAVVAPFGAGCATICQYPYVEGSSAAPRSVLGMFDVSARPFVPAGTISFTTPMAKFVRMIDNMEESFLITPAWAKVRRRIEGAKQT